MPANLPPQYHAAELAFRRAQSLAEKIEALETMMAVVPKHKGTDHLRADLRARLAALNREAERAGGGAARSALYDVRREGAGQVALVGPPNVGKSRLVGALTDADPKVADYPFTTQLPQPAMMPFENVQVQLVDLPPIVAGETPGWERAIFRRADALLLVVDLSADPLADWAAIAAELAAARVVPHAPDATVAIGDEALHPKPALVAAAKADAPAADVALELLGMEVDGRLPIMPVSAETGAGLDELRRRVFAALGVLRVYTKPPGKPVDRARPFVLRRGATVDDLADAIHHDLREKLRYGLLWGASGRFAGQRVGRDHALEDGDVVELYA